LKGSVEVIVDGKRHYKFSDAKGIQRLGSWRFYDKVPTIEIIAKDNTLIKSLDIKEYKY